MAANEKFNSYLKTRLRKIILGGALLIISIACIPIIEKVIGAKKTLCARLAGSKYHKTIQDRENEVFQNDKSCCFYM